MKGEFGEENKRYFTKLKSTLIKEPNFTVLFNDVAICAQSGSEKDSADCDYWNMYCFWLYIELYVEPDRAGQALPMKCQQLMVVSHD